MSSNPGKLREARAILAPYGIRVRAVRRSLVEPQAPDLETVVRAKIAATRDLSGTVIVEDSGLFIPSLGGFPGVYSAPILKVFGFGPLLELLRSRDRSAYYRAVVGVRSGRGTRLYAGEVHGRISRAPRGENGFGYDPIFVPEGGARTFGEMAPAEKDRLSHRARALGAWLRREAGRSK